MTPRFHLLGDVMVDITAIVVEPINYASDTPARIFPFDSVKFVAVGIVEPRCSYPRRAAGVLVTRRMAHLLYTNYDWL